MIQQLSEPSNSFLTAIMEWHLYTEDAPSSLDAYSDETWERSADFARLYRGTDFYAKAQLDPTRKSHDTETLNFLHHLGAIKEDANA